MKKSELRQIIKEEVESIVNETRTSTKDFEIKDEIGKFFVVTSPFKNDTKEDILFESDVFSFANQVRGGLTFEEVLGLYKNKSDANRIATEALKERDTHLDELKSSMEEFRNHKKETEDKKSKAKELIQKLQK
jgi:hypothetical protein